MDGKLRKSGLDIIGDIPWGTHFCQFYQIKEDLLDIIIPYLKAGLENNELCIWVIPESLNVAALKENLRKSIPDFEIYLEKRQIEIIPYGNWYLGEGIFNSQKILDALTDKLNKALANGYDGLRLTEAVSSQKDSEDTFIDYEKILDSVISKSHMLALCTYSFERYSPINVIEISANHDFSLGKKKNKWEQIKNYRQKKDIEYKQTEQALKENEERYRMLFSNMSEAFFLAEIICDKDGKPYDYLFLEINPAFESHVGVKRGQILGKSHLEVFHRANPLVIEKYGKVALSGKPANFEFFSKAINRYIDIYLFSPEKGKFAGIFRDVTERKQTEEKLRESEQRFLLALRNAPISVAAQDRDLRYVWTYNQRTARPEEILGHLDNEIFTPEEAAYVTAIK